jgi:DNA-binding SARP family transcriptional activator
MSTMRIRLFGKFDVQKGNEQASGFEARKVQELFSYLLLHRGTPNPREAVAGALWVDSPAAQCKKYLRQALWQLQSGLDNFITHDDGKLLDASPETLQLKLAADSWLDVAVFESAYKCVEGLNGQDLDPGQVSELETATGLYGEGLMQGFYSDWCLLERERLHTFYLTLLDKLSGYCEAHRKLESGISYAARILEHEPACERTHRKLMRLHYRAGDRTAALRQYDRCVASLRDELGVRPSRRTLSLWEQIKSDQAQVPELLPSSTPPSNFTYDASHSATESSTSLREMLDRLKRMGATLSEMQAQLSRDIQLIETNICVGGGADSFSPQKDAPQDA